MLNVSRLWCGVPGSMDHLRYSEATHQKPVVVWNSTRRCNLHCVHCYSKSENKPYPNELTTVEAKAFIADLAAFRVPVLLFSGGEPLLRSDLFELAHLATEKGIRAVLSTNGTLINPQAAKQLKEAASLTLA
jgi:MoaA/NifB/PqqE/SkfB family radical SAM enzyme